MTTSLYWLNLECVTLFTLRQGVNYYTAKIVNELYVREFVYKSVSNYWDITNNYFGENV